MNRCIYSWQLAISDQQFSTIGCYHPKNVQRLPSRSANMAQSQFSWIHTTCTIFLALALVKKWAADQWSTCNLGDARRTQRAIKVGAAIA
ncbi:MAG: hypothetical protein GDA43_25470 [Hormoscilla sp. SP5CHS1]|nr:hypothetical protein [Hormoscilla sp. SP5CHS1]